MADIFGHHPVRNGRGSTGTTERRQGNPNPPADAGPGGSPLGDRSACCAGYARRSVRHPGPLAARSFDHQWAQAECGRYVEAIGQLGLYRQLGAGRAVCTQAFAGNTASVWLSAVRAAPQKSLARPRCSAPTRSSISRRLSAIRMIPSGRALLSGTGTRPGHSAVPRLTGPGQRSLLAVTSVRSGCERGRWRKETMNETIPYQDPD
jgi:hypothetical protein